MHLRIPYLDKAPMELQQRGFLDKIPWDLLPPHRCLPYHGNSLTYPTFFRIGYSKFGLFVKIECIDSRISTNYMTDFSDIFRGDVFELFLWPDTSIPVYFEYEISPLGVELPLLVANNGGTFMGWLPWHYEEDRRIHKRVRVTGGCAVAGASITGWIVELLLPFALLKGLKNVPPMPGTQWKGNFFRMDYDDSQIVNKWEWDPRTKGEFHQFRKFGTLHFEGNLAV
ncbi:MAG: carbohydrate-binding family 9-like protein [Patescibacteria group bacterium]|nr:carbohydrate-binding family 9-like protein [Patescibacteria group bacterium]